MRPEPPKKEEDLMIHLERWKRDLKELDEQEEEGDIIPDRYRMVALKQLLGTGTRVKEYVTMKEVEGAMDKYEDMLRIVQQWAENRRVEDGKKMDIDSAERGEAAGWGWSEEWQNEGEHCGSGEIGYMGKGYGKGGKKGGKGGKSKGKGKGEWSNR